MNQPARYPQKPSPGRAVERGPVVLALVAGLLAGCKSRVEDVVPPPPSALDGGINNTQTKEVGQKPQCALLTPLYFSDVDQAVQYCQNIAKKFRAGAALENTPACGGGEAILVRDGDRSWCADSWIRAEQDGKTVMDIYCKFDPQPTPASIIAFQEKIERGRSYPWQTVESFSIIDCPDANDAGLTQAPAEQR